MKIKKWSKESARALSGPAVIVPVDGSEQRKINASARNSGSRSPIPPIRATAIVCSTTRIKQNIFKKVKKGVDKFRTAC